MEEQEYSYVKQEILKLTGVDLDCYKPPQMQRRLRTYLLRLGHANWRSFFYAVRDDPAAVRKLKDYLTINVSSFYRDPEKFDHLRKSILPTLMNGRPSLRVWSAGCSHGHEPYTLAFLLAEVTDPYCPHYVLATDIDSSALEWSRAGGPYMEDEIKNVPPAVLSRYFERREDGYWVVETRRRRIAFRYHNVLSDPFEKRFDLIVCRNVVIYFTAEVKTVLYRRFHDSLRTGGVMFVGGTEFLSRPSEMGFESAGISFYRRVD